MNHSHSIVWITYSQYHGNHLDCKITSWTTFLWNEVRYKNGTLLWNWKCQEPRKVWVPWPATDCFRPSARNRGRMAEKWIFSSQRKWGKKWPKNGRKLAREWLKNGILGPPSVRPTSILWPFFPSSEGPKAIVIPRAETQFLAENNKKHGK